MFYMNRKKGQECSRVFFVRANDFLYDLVSQELKIERDSNPGLKISRSDFIRGIINSVLLYRGVMREKKAKEGKKL